MWQVAALLSPEVDVLDPQATTFEQPQTRSDPIQQTRSTGVVR